MEVCNSMESKVFACPLLCELQTGVPWVQGVLQRLSSPRGRAGGARGRAAAEGQRPRSGAPRGPQGALPARETRPGRCEGRGSGVSGVLPAAAGPSSCSGQLPQPVGTWCCEPTRFCRVRSCTSHGGVLHYAKTKRLNLPRWWCGRGAFGTGALCVLLAFWKFIAKVTRR